MEISNLPEFRTLVIRMLNELKGRIDEFSENFSKQKTKKEIENRKEPVRNEGYQELK